MVIDILNGNEWQFLDMDNLGILPWYTRSCLDEIEKIDFSDKIIFEYGLGLSTLYYARKCKKVNGVETNLKWFINVVDTLEYHNIISKTELKFVGFEPVIIEDYVLSYGSVSKYDIIVIDGIFRNECIKSAIKYSKKGAIIIIDNWMQPSVEIASQEVQVLVNNCKHKIYKQDGHPDWQTAIITV